MNRRWLRLTAIVAEREIRQRGRSRAFAVSTIILLLVVAAGVAIPAILAHHAKPQRVGIVGGPVAAMTAIVQEAGRVTDTGVTLVPEPSLAAAEAALRSGQLDAVLVSDTEVVVKQVPIAGSSGSGGALASAIADVAGLSKLLGELPPGAAASGVTLPVRGLTPPSASHAGSVRGRRRARLAGGDLRGPGRAGHRVDGTDRGDDLRPVHPAHRLPRPAPRGARARAGLLSLSPEFASRTGHRGEWPGGQAAMG